MVPRVVKVISHDIKTLDIDLIVMEILIVRCDPVNLSTRDCQTIIIINLEKFAPREAIRIPIGDSKE